MRGLVPYAWRSVVARPARSLLTAFGVAIGVAVLVAALAVDAGFDASIDRTVTSLTGRADLRVAAFTETGLSGSTIAAIDGVPGVALTAPAIERRTYLSAEPGRVSATDEPVTLLGIDPAREARVRDLVLARGTGLDALDEPAALITERLAAAEALDVGDELPIFGTAAPVRLRVVGVLAGDGPELGASGRTVVLPLLTAASLTTDEGEPPPTVDTLTGVTRIDVVLAAGASADDVTAGLTTALTREPYVLSVPHDVAASMRASTADLRATIGLLAAIALFAAAFLILNTMAMTVVERIRELGLLRAAGASRGQVVRVVLLQALVVGGAGSLAGLALGAVLATVAAGWLRASGAVPIDGAVVSPTVLVAGFAGGLAITLVAALEPARRAASVSPVTALRVRGDPRTSARANTSWLVVIVVVVAAVAVLFLPVGLAMLVALGSVAANARTAATAWLSDVVPGDEILTAITPVPVGEAGVDEEIASVAGVVRATPIATFDLAFDGTRLDATAIRGADFDADGRLSFVAGDRSAALAALDAGGAVVLPRSRADRLGVGLGDGIAVLGPDGLVELRVAGIVERSFPGRSGESALVGWRDALGRFGVVGADSIAVRYDAAKRGTASVAVGQLAAQLALTASPVARVAGALADALDRVFGLLDLLALAAVVVAGLGIVNTLSMDTWERGRELGMLRAAGMSRRQVWRSIVVEAGIIGVIGALVGALTGVGIGALLAGAAGGRLEPVLAIPWGSIALALVLGVALAMLAAAQPARIAGRRSIVTAVRGE